MGDGENASLRLQFNPKVRLEFHGSTITSDAGLLAFREFDDALGLTGGNEALVVDQSADQDDQDWRTVGAPCRKAGVSAC